MHRVIHHDEKQPTGGCGHVGMPAIQEDSNMVVPMKENKGLFMNNNEECIEQFGKFAQNEQLDPKTGRPTPVQCRGVIAQIITKRIIGEIVIKLRGGAESPDPREEGEAKVPKGEDFAPRPGRIVFHVSATSDDE